MEETILKLLTGNPEPWQIVIGVVILLSVILPRLATLWDTWVGIRQNHGQIKRQKEIYEILKLQYEIEVLRKEHSLNEIMPIFLEELPKKEEQREIQKDLSSPFWNFLIKHPVVGEICLRVLQGLVGFYLVMFSLGIIVTPFMFYFGEELTTATGEKLNPFFMVIGWFFYIALTYLLYKWYRRCKNLVKELRQDVVLQQEG